MSHRNVFAVMAVVLACWASKAHASPPSIATAVVTAGPGELKSQTVVVNDGEQILNITLSNAAPDQSSAPPKQQAPAASATSWDAAPTCTVYTNAVKDSAGHVWAWDTVHSMSCAIRGNTNVPKQEGFAAAPRCSSVPTTTNSKPDASGNLWGWEASASCAFKDDTGKPIVIVPVTNGSGRRLAEAAQSSSDVPRPSTIGSGRPKPSLRLRARGLLQNPDLPSQRAAISQPNPSPAQGASSPQPSGSPQPDVARQAQNLLQQAGVLSPAGTPQPSSQPATSTGQSATVYNGGFAAGWQDASYGVRAFTRYQPAGKNTGTSLCKIVPNGGALAAKWVGSTASPIAGKRSLDLWTYVGSGQVPGLQVALTPKQGAGCSDVSLQSGATKQSQDGWAKYSLQVDQFGCGPRADLVSIEFRNKSPAYDALVCLDEIQLVV